MIIPFSKLPSELNKFAADANKCVRLASYRTLTNLAIESRNAIIATYPKKFPDENGVRKNKGVPRLVVYDRNIDKSIKDNPSIRIYADDKISFMEKQEFKTTLIGGKSGSSAAVPFKESLKTMRSGTKGMKDRFTISNVMSAAKKAMQSSLKGGSNDGRRKPKPFFMETKSGHSMVAIRQGRAKNPIIPLYHFDRKREFRKNRWDYFKTIDGVVVSMTDKIWGEQLKKILDKK